MGIEPTSEAWEASVLPLNYTRAATILTVIAARGAGAGATAGRARRGIDIVSRPTTAPTARCCFGVHESDSDKVGAAAGRERRGIDIVSRPTTAPTARCFFGVHESDSDKVGAAAGRERRSIDIVSRPTTAPTARGVFSG